MNRAYLLTGGNMGNITDNLSRAAELIERYCGHITQRSAIYQTAPWGKKEQPAFLNQALEINTILPAPKLLENILTIEKKMGRVRDEKYGPRIIDIDIIFFNREIIHSKDLVVPHPEMQNRRFVLEPLHEIAPNYIHPVLRKNISRLLEECPDTLPVKKVIDGTER